MCEWEVKEYKQTCRWENNRRECQNQMQMKADICTPSFFFTFQPLFLFLLWFYSDFPNVKLFLKFSWPCTNTSFKAKSISYGIQKLNALINAIIKEIKWHIQIKRNNKGMVTLICIRKIWIIAITISLINDILCVWKLR